MVDYAPPLRDIRFALDLVDLGGLAALPGFEHADPDTVHDLLAEFARFVREVLAPLDRIGDRQGARLDPGSATVTMPDGFVDAYRRYVDAGWGSVPFSPDHGGGGFPWLVAVAMQELLTSANMAFSLCPMLTQGAIEMLGRHGTEAQHERYLSKLISGEWTGTMTLTEPEAGSDLGAVRTRAVPAGDGTWRITGTKIFITYGEHDLGANIVHLVLARAPGAPAGTRGLSCFVVPKFLVEDDGRVGVRNDVRCLSIEHKLGIHASPTCVLSFGGGGGAGGDEGGSDGAGAVGELVGEVHDGMRLMFTMMNNARLSVGLEGLGIAERAYQQALTHASERRQGRAPGAGTGTGTSSPLVDHADVRRMLVTMRSHIEAMRALVYTNARAIDLARHHPDATVREAQAELVDLLTPVSKAWCTDLGNELTSLALQVHGGMGFIEETGIAQRCRDVRVAAIYEGTNGIQAIDLVGRKLAMRSGAVVRSFLDGMGALDPELGAAGEELASVRRRLGDAIGALVEATEWVLERGRADPVDALAAATPYLRMFGTVTGGWLLARQALAARALLATTGGSSGGEAGAGSEDGDDDFLRADFLRAKVTTARFYAEQVLPQARGLLGAVTAGKATLFAVEPASLASS